MQSCEEAGGREKRLRFADSRDAMLPAFVPAQDLDLDAEKINRHVGLGQAWQTDGVFFRGDDHLEIATDAAGNETVQLGLGVAVMIGVALGKLEPRAEVAQPFVRTLRPRGGA